MPSWAARVRGYPDPGLLQKAAQLEDVIVGGRYGATNLPSEGGEIPPVEEMPVRSFTLYVLDKPNRDAVRLFIASTLAALLAVERVDPIHDGLADALRGRPEVATDV